MLVTEGRPAIAALSTIAPTVVTPRPELVNLIRMAGNSPVLPILVDRGNMGLDLKVVHGQEIVEAAREAGLRYIHCMIVCPDQTGDAISKLFQMLVESR